jgi:hypothetical protein
MAVTKITDLIVPAIWVPYMQELTSTKSNLIQSGIVEADPEYGSLATGGGATINMPFFQDLTGTSEVLSEAGSLTAQNIAASTDVAVILRRGKAWGTGQLARYKSSADPAIAIANLVADWWVRDRQSTLINILKGVFASTTMANEHVEDVAIEDGNNAAAGNLISSNAVINALGKLGDEIDAIVGIALHSDIYYELEKQNVIEYLAPAVQGAEPIRTYRGKTLIVDDSLPKVAGGTSGFKYDTYLFGAGAIAFGLGNMDPEEAVQTDRDILAGEEYLATREQCIMHPKGVKFNSDTVSGDTPTNAELATASNWTRVYERKNVRLAMLRTNG